MKSKLLFTIIFITSAFLGSLSGVLILQKVTAAWTPPTSPPPQSNVPTPLNVSDQNQTKKGGITLGKDLWIDPSISNSDQAGLKLFSKSGDFWYIKNELSNLTFQQNSNTLLTQDSAGNLTVAGDIKTSKTVYSNNLPVLTKETDPTINKSNSTNNSFCTFKNNKIVCNTTPNAVDTRIGSLNSGKWCYSNGSQIVCDKDQPLLKEVDPRVNNLVNNRFCTAGQKMIDGTNKTVVNCNLTDDQVKNRLDVSSAFGGMFTRYAIESNISNVQCLNPNPLTGACGCSSGYATEYYTFSRLGLTVLPDGSVKDKVVAFLYYCWKF